MKKESPPLDDKALTVKLSKKFLDEIKKLVEANLNPNGLSTKKCDGTSSGFNRDLIQFVLPFSNLLH